MSFYQVGYKSAKYQNKGKIPGTIMLVLGIALVTWFSTDLILISQNLRLQYLSDMLSVVRLVIGVLFAFAGIWIVKLDDMKTIRPK